jgi:hypothetical protein
MLFACALYFLSLVLSLALAFDFDLARAGDLALAESFDFGRDAALLCRRLLGALDLGADGAASAPPS